MRPLISTAAALMAFLLSDVISALVVTVTACSSLPTPQSILTLPLVAPSSSPQAPVVVISTITVLPVPLNTPSSIFPPKLSTGKGIPSGIFITGHGTASGAAHPTGYPKYRNCTRTHHRPTTSSQTASTSISSKIPFFTLTYTGTLPLPTLTPTASPEVTTLNVGSLISGNGTSTDCPGMESATIKASSSSITTKRLESNSAGPTSTPLTTSPSYEGYRRKRAARAGRT